MLEESKRVRVLCGEGMACDTESARADLAWKRIALSGSAMRLSLRGCHLISCFSSTAMGPCLGESSSVVGVEAHKLSHRRLER